MTIGKKKVMDFGVAPASHGSDEGLGGGVLDFLPPQRDAIGLQPPRPTFPSAPAPVSYTTKITLTEQRPNDPMFSQQNWLDDRSGFDADINVTSVWPDYTGRGIRVGIYDDAVEAGHAEFAGRYDASRHFVDAAGVVHDGRVSTDIFGIGGRDVLSHGTSVAGIVAAANDGVGTVGVAYGATITGVKAYGFEGRTDAYVEQMLRHQVEFDVVNHSYWFGERFPTYDATQMARSAALKHVADVGRDGLGTIVVTSAGNERDDDVPVVSTTRGILSGDRHSVTVAAITGDGNLAWVNEPADPFSSAGSSVLVSASGQGELTTDRTGESGYVSGDYVHFNGTSAAAPQVTGVVALMLEANPDLGWRDVREILASSARLTPGMSPGTGNAASDWNGGGHVFSNDVGFGLVDAHAAVRLAETWTEQKTSANEQFWFSNWSMGGGRIDVPMGQTQSLRLDMPGNVDLETVELDLSFATGGIGQVSIELVSPSGTTSELLPYSVNDFVSVDGRLILTSNAFLGEESGGTWTVRVTALNESTWLRSWQVNTYGAAASDDDTYIYTDDFGALIAADGSRAVLADGSGNDTINAAATRYNALVDLGGSQVSMIAGRQVTLSGAIENAIGGDGDDTLIGTRVGNTLQGGRGDDTLVSGGWNLSIDGGGLDVLDGGAGDDRLVVNAAGPVRAIGGEGQDTLAFEFGSGTIAASVSVDLAAGEGLMFGGGPGTGMSRLWIEGVENVSGGAGNDSIFGDAGANRLSGGGGTDTLTGRGGNDVYLGVTADDAVVEEAGGGIDRVELAAGMTGYRLGANVEDLTLADVFVIPPLGDPIPVKPGAVPKATYFGNELRNTIRGNDAANGIDGGAGDDTIYGGGGNDVIVGGAGADRMSGGAGSDLFVFRSIAEFGSGRGGDVIADFVSGARPPGSLPFPGGPAATVVDRIDLSLIDANMTTAADDAFTFGTRPGGLGQLNASYGQIQDGFATRDVTYLTADVTGDRTPDFVLTLYGHLTFQEGNFIL